MSGTSIEISQRSQEPSQVQCLSKDISPTGFTERKLLQTAENQHTKKTNENISGEHGGNAFNVSINSDRNGNLSRIDDSVDFIQKSISESKQPEGQKNGIFSPQFRVNGSPNGNGSRFIRTMFGKERSSSSTGDGNVVDTTVQINHDKVELNSQLRQKSNHNGNDERYQGNQINNSTEDARILQSKVNTLSLDRHDGDGKQKEMDPVKCENQTNDITLEDNLSSDSLEVNEVPRVTDTESSSDFTRNFETCAKEENSRVETGIEVGTTSTQLLGPVEIGGGNVSAGTKLNTETNPSSVSSETKIASKKTYLMSKLPIKTSTGTTGVKGTATEKSPKTIDASGNHIVKTSGHDLHTLEDSCIDRSSESEVQEFERSLSAAEGGEKRRSRGLWSQSWNPETIIQKGLQHDTSALSRKDNTSVSTNEPTENFIEKGLSGESGSSQTSCESVVQTKQVTDENDNFCHSHEPISECLNNQCNILTSNSSKIRNTISSDKYEAHALFDKSAKLVGTSSLDESGSRRLLLYGNITDSPKTHRTHRHNASDSCIPINVSGSSRSLGYKRERPLSASTVMGNKRSQETSALTTLSTSLQLDQPLAEGKLTELMSVRSLSSSSGDLDSHGSEISSKEITKPNHEYLSDTNLALHNSNTPFGPLSSTPIKLPGAAKETLRQRQVMEVSPSIDHLSVDASALQRPSTLNMNDLDSTSEDGCYVDSSHTDRWNRENIQSLKTKHSRQIHDLQAYYETELRRLQEEISDLHRRVVSRPSSSPMIRLKYLEQIREELDQRCQQFERRNNQLQEDCERWSQRCFEMERRCRTSECERQTVYERCSRLEQEKRKVEVELLKTQEMLNESFRERRQLEEHLLSLQKKEISWNGMIKQGDNVLSDLQNELQSTRELCANKDHAIKRLEQQRDELRRNLDNTVHQVDELKQTMCVSPKDRDLFQKLLEEYEALYRQHQKMRAMYKDAIDKMESNAVEVDVLKGLLSKLENDCTKLRESKELFGSSSESKSKIPIRADGSQTKKKDCRRDLFKPTLNIFQTPSSSSADLTASDSESVQSDKANGRHQQSYPGDKNKDKKTERIQSLGAKLDELAKSRTTQVENCFVGSIWEAAERDHAKDPSMSEKYLNNSKQALSWSVPFSDSSLKLRPDLANNISQRERKFSDSTCSDSLKQVSPALSRKEQNWVIESRGGVTRFDVVFDGPNRNKPSKPKEIVRPEKELDAYGPPKRYQSSKDTSCASSADDSDNSFLTRFSSAEQPSPRLQTKKDHKAGRTSTLLAGEKDTKAFEERKLKIAGLEQEFKKLTQERESIESQLRKIPKGRTTRKKLDEKEALEERLEQVLKRIGTVKMSLRRFDAL